MGTGRNTVTAFGKQPGKGIVADELKVLSATQNTLEDEIGTGTSAALTGVPFSQHTFVNSIGCGGNVAAEISTATFPEIIKYAIGPEKEDPVEVGDGLYKHTFIPDLKFTDWLTFLKQMKDEGYYELYKDCRINQIDFNVVGQSIITYTLAILGISSEQVDGDPEPLYTLIPNDGEKLYAWDVKLIWKDGKTGETDITGIINEFTFTNNNNLNPDKRGLGRERKALDAQGREHTVTITADFNKDVYMDIKADAKLGNHVNLRIEIGKAADGTNPFLAIEYPKLMLNQAPTANISGPDEVQVNINGTADWDMTVGYNVKFEVIDDNAEKY